MVSLELFTLAAVLVAAGPAPGQNETVLIDFSADWCGPCRTMRPTVDRLMAAGYPVRLVNVTHDPALATQYNVTKIPCFVMLVGGKEVDRVVGMASYGRLEQMLKRTHEPSPPPVGRRPHSRGSAGLPRVSVDSHGEEGPGRAELAPNTPARPLPNSSERDQLIRSTVRIRVDDEHGQSYGTGTMIDARDGEVLVLTCGHIFREAKDDGQITIDLFGPDAPQALPGRLISYDLTRDLGFVSIRPGVTVTVAQVALKDHGISQGDRVRCVGCLNGLDPNTRQTHITSVDRYGGPPNIEVAGMPEEGCSGGGLFDGEGRVIGVCFAADWNENEGVYAGLDSIQAELDRLGLTDIYVRARSGIETAPNSNIVRAEPPPLPMQMPSAGQGVPIDRESSASTRQERLTPSERAALAEIRKRSPGNEVICIIRPDDPLAKSEVIVLENVSSAFIDQLTKGRSRLTQPQLTSKKVPLARRQGPAAQQEYSDSLGWSQKSRPVRSTLDP